MEKWRHYLCINPNTDNNNNNNNTNTNNNKKMLIKRYKLFELLI